jgi:hypothetical protein
VAFTAVPASLTRVNVRAAVFTEPTNVLAGMPLPLTVSPGNTFLISAAVILVIVELPVEVEALIVSVKLTRRAAISSELTTFALPAESVREGVR